MGEQAAFGTFMEGSRARMQMQDMRAEILFVALTLLLLAKEGKEASRRDPKLPLSMALLLLGE